MDRKVFSQGGGPVRRAVLALATALVLGGGGVTALAQSSGASSTEGGQGTSISARQTGWIVTCDNRADPARLACALSIRISAANNQRIAGMTLRGAPGSQTATLALPHGVSIPKGVSVSIDGGSASQAAITRADAAGAYATLPVGSETLERMKRGNTMRLSMEAVGGRPVVVEVPLSGFSRAFDMMTKASG